MTLSHEGIPDYQERPTLSDREERRRDTLDAQGVPMGRAYEMTTGTYIDTFPVAAARRVVGKGHYHPSKVPDGDMGLNDPSYAGPKGKPAPTELDRTESARLGEIARLEKIQRDISKFMGDGMDRATAENLAYGLHRNKTGEVLKRQN